jgi:DNA-binding transcriptional LysR family regulator
MPLSYCLTMELRHMRYFVAVAEARNFTRAAARLHLTQPSLSRQIRALENELGVSLLHRGKGGITLTAAGNEYLARARKLLADSAAAVRVTQAVGRSEHRHRFYSLTALNCWRALSKFPWTSAKRKNLTLLTQISLGVGWVCRSCIVCSI